MLGSAFRVIGLTALLWTMSWPSSLSGVAYAQEDETYDFDGVGDMDPQPADPTDWMTSANWSDGGADPLPPFGPEIPDFDTRVEIQTSNFGVDAPEIGPGDMAQAFEIRIGRFAGEGLLTMSGGTLETADSCTALPFTCNRRFRVGAADVGTSADRNPGTFNISDGTVTTDTLWIGSGSQGFVNMSGGEVNTRADLSMDWTFDAQSQLTLTGGVINVGSNLRMYRNSLFVLDGGSMFVDGFAGLGYEDANVTQTPNATVNISDGMLEADGFLRVQGSVTVDGGVLRADSFNEAASTGTIEINDDGLLQFSTAEESISAVEALIAGNVITTNGMDPLVVEVVDIGGTDFTQVSVASAGQPGDFESDGDIDGSDFLAWQRGFPGTFDANDLNDWQMNFPAGGAFSAAAVPEPTTATLLVSSCLLFAIQCGVRDREKSRRSARN